MKTDLELAVEIATRIIHTEPCGPFHLAYRFDARKGPPPAPCDGVLGKFSLCWVEYADAHTAIHWMVEALLKGLSVSRYAGRGWRNPIAEGSLSSARRAAEYRERLASETRDDEDQIPF